MKLTSVVILMTAAIAVQAQESVKLPPIKVTQSAPIPADKALTIQLAKADQTLVASKINPLLDALKDLSDKVRALGQEISAESTARGQKAVEEVCKLVGLTPDDVRANKCLLSADMKTVSRAADK